MRHGDWVCSHSSKTVARGAMMAIAKEEGARRLVGSELARLHNIKPIYYQKVVFCSHPSCEKVFEEVRYA